MLAPVASTGKPVTGNGTKAAADSAKKSPPA
jgi:hypothetical protein